MAANSTRAPYGAIASTGIIIRDTTFDASAENDLFGGACTLHAMSIDNTGNVAQVYAKFVDALAITVGTTAPNIIIPVAAGTIVEMTVARQAGVGGIPFATGVSCACVTTGGTAGAVSPTSPVVLALYLA